MGNRRIEQGWWVMGCTERTTKTGQDNKFVGYSSPISDVKQNSFHQAPTRASKAFKIYNSFSTAIFAEGGLAYLRDAGLRLL
jgi:hypothetical protein